MSIFEKFRGKAEKGSELLTGTAFVLSLLAVGYLLQGKSTKETNSVIQKTLSQEEMDALGPDGRKVVKIGEIKVELDKTNNVIQITKIENSAEEVLDKLSYIEAYFQSGDKELAILKSNPTSKIVCEFSDSLMRNENNKRKLESIWNYFSKNQSKLNIEFINTLNQILSRASVIKPVTIESVGKKLSEPVQAGTLCGIKFDIAFSFINSAKVSEFQTLTKTLLVEMSKYFSSEIKSGKADEETKRIANEFISFILDLTPENNR